MKNPCCSCELTQSVLQSGFFIGIAFSPDGRPGSVGCMYEPIIMLCMLWALEAARSFESN